MTNSVEVRIAQRGPFADSHTFGEIGAYERLVGRVHFAVDPRAPAQSGIVDIDKAPLNAAGLVEFAADFCILKPLDMAKGNRRLLFGYGNRGNKRELQFFNDAPASNKGYAQKAHNQHRRRCRDYHFSVERKSLHPQLPHAFHGYAQSLPHPPPLR